jgi:hypothetical protein
MEPFNDLQTIWNGQADSNSNISSSELIKIADDQAKIIKVKHIWTIGILSTTTAILMVYFVWIGVYEMNAFTVGLGIMIWMLLFRIILEWVSANKLRSIRLDSTLIEYRHNMKQFYNWRKKIHFVLTPIIYFAYIGGFILLLPVFKENFSQWMNLYILVSGFGFFIIFGFFMVRQIQNEMKLLKKISAATAADSDVNVDVALR